MTNVTAAQPRTPPDRTELARSIYRVSHLTGEFTLRSGAVSHEYFDKYRFESDPQLLLAIAGAMPAIVPDDVEALAGLELGGVPLATVLSQVTGLPALFVRKEAKTYGTCKLAEGGELEGRRLLVVEDVVTSGGAVLDAARELRARGRRARPGRVRDRPRVGRAREPGRGRPHARRALHHDRAHGPRLIERTERVSRDAVTARRSARTSGSRRARRAAPDRGGALMAASALSTSSLSRSAGSGLPLFAFWRALISTSKCFRIAVTTHFACVCVSVRLPLEIAHRLVARVRARAARAREHGEHQQHEGQAASHVVRR